MNRSAVAKEDVSVTNFRKYLQINTMHPDPDYEIAVKFLCELAKELELETAVVRVTPTNPVVIITWPGKDPSLPALLLNSHMDVVPVFPQFWTHDPFSAYKDEHGTIFARGAQDMKSVGIQYLEAVRRLKRNNVQLLRTIHITFVPDEEVGGYKGMKLFIKTDEFKKLNVGFALDEGFASSTDFYKIYYAERSKWWLKVTCHGQPGHGSFLFNDTAAEKMQRVVNKFLAFRDEQKRQLEANKDLTIGRVITVNLTLLNGGVQVNVVPAEISLGFDIRVPPFMDHGEVQKMFETMAKDAGGVPEWVEIPNSTGLTATDDSNPWWKTFSTTLDSLGMKYQTDIFSGGTDIRYLRDLKYPALGFSPMANTPHLAHDHNECLNEKTFLHGVTVYEHLLTNLANLRI